VGEAEEILTYAMRANCYHPLWFSLSKVLNSGHINTIQCDTADKDFVVGGYVIIRTNDDFLCDTITTITSNTIVLTNSRDITLNAYIAPLILMTPQKSNRYEFKNRKISKMDLSFKELL
jgi:hypothetical protein